MASIVDKYIAKTYGSGRKEAQPKQSNQERINAILATDLAKELARKIMATTTSQV